MKTVIGNDKDGALIRVILDSERYHLHQGKAFKAKTGDPALGVAATKIIAFKTPAGDEDIHMVVIPDSSLQATTELLKAPTVTIDTGTATKWQNRNQKSANLSGSLSLETTPQPGYYNLDPTITADGEVFDTIYTSADNKYSGQSRWVLAPDTIYAIRLTSAIIANIVNLELLTYETEEYL